MSETATQQATTATDAEKANAAETLREPADVLDQLLKPEVQESLTQLVESLPKLTEMLGFMTKAYDFGMAVATDKVLIEDFAGGLAEFVKPVQKSAKRYAAAVIEANERARMDHTTISAFGLLRMLKDPQMQKMLRFAQAFLNVLNEQEKHSDHV